MWEWPQAEHEVFEGWYIYNGAYDVIYFLEVEWGGSGMNEFSDED